MKQTICNVATTTTALSPFPFQKEAHMEEVIIEHPELLRLGDNDDPPVIISVEKAIPEKKSRTDIVAFWPDEELFGVLELKKGIAVKADVEQLKSYLDNIPAIFERIQADSGNDSFSGSKANDFLWIGMLCAENIDYEAKQSLEKDKIERKHNISPSLCYAELLRLWFGAAKEERRIVFFSNIVFKRPRNYRKISVAGGIPRPKRRAVLEVIRRVATRPGMTLQKLQVLFPEDIHSFPVVVPVSEISGDRKRRYFTGNNETIRLPCDNNREVAVCNQWGTLRNRNGKSVIQRFMEAANLAGIQMKFV